MPPSFVQQLVSFVCGHLLQVVLFVPGALVLTLAHESAHALAVALQGGSITEFQWLPSASSWGHVRFTFPSTIHYSSTLVSLAPHLLSLLLVMAALLLAWLRPIRSDRMAPYVYFWLYFIPVADVGFAFLAWLLGGDNDVANAFGAPTTLSAVWVVAYAVMVCTLGYVVQSRLYDRLRLGWVPYSALVLAALLLMCGVLYVGFGLSGRA